MTLPLPDFIRLLAHGNLLTETNLQKFQRWVAESAAQTADELARKLVEQKWVTSYQADVLLSGQAGPFRFGNYMILDRYSEGPLAGNFKARHISTNHPVLLSFAQGNSAADLDNWRCKEDLVEQLSHIGSEFLLETYQTIVLPQYRFVVSQRPDGVTLEERLPGKARLPWKDACLIMSQVAAALETLHSNELMIKAVSPSSIWIAKSGFTQLRYDLDDSMQEIISAAAQGDVRWASYLAPELTLNRAATFSSDWFSLGCCLYRAITGRHAPAATLSADSAGEQNVGETFDLKKLELPDDLEALLSQLLAPDPRIRLPQHPISELLARLAEKSLSKLRPVPLPTLVSFREAISPNIPGSKSIPPTEALAIRITDKENPRKEADSSSEGFILVNPGEQNLSPGQPSKQNSPVRHKAKSRKWASIVITLVAIWFFCGLLALAAHYASKQPAPGYTSSLAGTHSESPTAARPESELSVPDNSAVTIAPATEKTQAVLTQKLIKDDRLTLWQSPTEGSALSLNDLPSNPKIVLVFRPAEILDQPEGQLLLRALGPDFNSIVERWSTIAGTRLEQIERLIVSLHSNESFQYEYFVNVELKEPVDTIQALSQWQNPQPIRTDSEKTFFKAREIDLAYYIIPDVDKEQSGDAPEDSKQVVRRFAIGSARLIGEVLDIGSNPLSGAIADLAKRTDSQRHLNILFLRPALFNDEGLALMVGKLQPVNRELAILFPDEVQAACISLHLDQGTYLELQFAKTADLKGGELLERMENEFRSLRNRLTDRISALAPHTYWDRVRGKFHLMVVDGFRSLRWGVENGEVIANSWLPPMAGHNLLAASELALSLSAASGSFNSAVMRSSEDAAPLNLTQLLERKRDLVITNPPDLNLLMSDLESEINSEFPSLPFKFKIRLMGPDLQVEGITQNQRPGELNIRQKTLSELLTKIMVSANPAKDITGPADPRCKLVWAIADDPDQAGQPMIVITTRSAAKQKNYQLPQAFQIE